ncbi:major facilitator superfamily domain-containing protein [Coprinopsis sp. MPI-PUGE-AT-0042]|nr:major facilitator superfamily domain-containing protein [Coprinopsis sp. MPI-PUGE-AT-0042]
MNDHLRPSHALEPSEEELVKPTPLPKLQLFIAIFIQVAEPVTCTVIYPFVNDLIRSMGYYAGLVESVFYAAECLTVMHWGRKPILLGGMAGLAVSMFGFGLSKQYWTLILSRCLQGAVMAEITDETNRPQAFAFLPVAWSVGSTWGEPAIGGGFTHAAEKWPSHYPYFLPCVVAALVPLFAFLLASIALKETAPNVLRKRRLEELSKEGTASPLLEECTIRNYGATGTPSSTLRSSHGRPRSIDSLTDSSENDALLSSSDAPKKPSFREIFIPQVLIPISNFGFLAFLDQCVLVLLPLVYSTPMDLGGLSMTPSMIGSILGIWGILNGFFQVFCFAWVRRKLGHRNTYVLGVAGMGVVFAFGMSRVGPWVWAGIALQLGFIRFPCMFLYVAASAPNKSSLGTTNGLAQLQRRSESSGATTSSSLFALSWVLQAVVGLVDGWGRMVYIVLEVITVAALVWSMRLPKELKKINFGSHTLHFHWPFTYCKVSS